jgi:hypothetical protein
MALYFSLKTKITKENEPEGKSAEFSEYTICYKRS